LSKAEQAAARGLRETIGRGYPGGVLRTVDGFVVPFSELGEQANNFLGIVSCEPIFSLAPRPFRRALLANFLVIW